VTTVCAVARRGRVVMAADSMATLGNERVFGVRKIAELNALDPFANPDHPSVLIVGPLGDAGCAGR
jgi:ATP-dependent protease HslVU (ClpYQ) peptidase subunit